MAESTLNLLEYLHVQQTRFDKVKSALDIDDDHFRWSISLSYSFLKYRIERRDPESPLEFPSLQFQCTWKLDEETGTAAEVYCMDNSKTDIVKGHINPVSYKAFRTLHANIGELFTADEMRYIDIAESIAKQAYMCTSGDDYSPGYFSEIMLRPDGMILRQVNRKNSRSINHKQDYMMRDLEFFIPDESFIGPRPPKAYDARQIGAMVIDFSDRSSANNKQCGDFVKERIELEKSKFEA